jgi:hypothetical protein
MNVPAAEQPSAITLRPSPRSARGSARSPSARRRGTTDSMSRARIVECTRGSQWHGLKSRFIAETVNRPDTRAGRVELRWDFKRGTSRDSSVTRSSFVASIVFAGLVFLSTHSDGNQAHATYVSLFDFDVMSMSQQFTRPIADHLQGRVSRDRVAGLEHAGWAVSVSANGAASLNLLYHSLQLHGPHPSQLLAWHFAEGEYAPDAPRLLPVYGYPWELRVECADCRVRRRGFEAEFTSGRVRIAARKLREPNPPQQR